MRRAWLLLPLALAACGPKPVALPDDPIQRAATCGVVAAADARRQVGAGAKLTFEQQAHVLHYALLAGAADDSFDRDRSAAVVNAMPRLGDKVTAGDWQPLIGACDDAYPATRVQPVSLPKEALDAEAGCYALEQFVTTALRSQAVNYKDRMQTYDGLGRTLDAKLGATAKARGLSQQQLYAARNRALASLVKVGPPTATLDACVKRFG